MICAGRTKDNFRRCKNHTKFLFCRKHLWQPITALLFLVSTTSDFIGVKSVFDKKQETVTISKTEIEKLVDKIEKSYRKKIEESELYVDYSSDDNSVFLDDTDSTYSIPTHTDTTKNKEYINSINEVIALYENKQFKECQVLIEKIFNLPEKRIILNETIDLSDIYILSGFIVTCYLEKNQPVKAASTVLERTRYLKQWDYSLKNDLAYSLRKISLINSFSNAIDFIDSARSTYKTETLSYVWAAVPLSILSATERGKYNLNNSLTNDTKSNLKYILNKYPNDRFICYVHYALGNYKEAYKTGKNSRISDICAYTYARLIIDDILDYYGKQSKRKTIQDDNFYIEEEIYTDLIFKRQLKTRKEMLKAEEAITALSFLCESNPKSKFSRWASYWISWLYSAKGDYNLAGENALKLKFYAPQLKDHLTKLVNKKTLIKLLESTSLFYDPSESELDYNVEYNITILDKLSKAEIINLNANKYVICQYLTYLFLNFESERALAIYDSPKIKRNIFSNIELLKSNGENNELTDVVHLAEITKKISSASNSNEFNELREIIPFLRKEGNSYFAYNILKKILPKIKSENREFFNYVYIRFVVYFDSNNINSEVNSFLKKYPNSSLADDVLAEEIFTYFKVIDFPEAAFKGLKTLLAKYPKANAVDNALDILGDHYMYFCNKNIPNWQECCRNSIKLNEYFLRKYPFSTYRAKADNRLKRCQEMLYNKYDQSKNIENFLD